MNHTVFFNFVVELRWWSTIATFHTIPTVGNLQGGTFFVPAQTQILVKLIMAIIDDYLIGVELYLGLNIYLWPQPIF